MFGHIQLRVAGKMNTKDLLAKYQADVNVRGRKKAARWIEYPYFSVSNNETAVIRSPEEFLKLANNTIANFDDAGFSCIDIQLVSEYQAGRRLRIAETRARLYSQNGGKTSDTWTDHRIIRETKDGPRFVGLMNAYGGFFNMAGAATKISSREKYPSIEAITRAYEDAIMTCNMSALGSMLDAPTITVHGEETLVLDNFETFVQAAKDVAALVIDNGMSVIEIEKQAPRAVGAELVLAPITLHIKPRPDEVAQPYSQALFLRTAPDGVNCVAIINSIGRCITNLQNPNYV